MGQLYRLIFANGKSYIGITTKTAAARLIGHRTRCASTKGADTALYHAWRKYGEPSLVVLAHVKDSDLAATEVRAIAAFQTMLPNGYNMTEGGDISPMTLPEIVAKLRGNKNAAGSKHERSSGYRVKLSAALKGNRNSVGNSHGIGNKNAAGKRSAESIANIKSGIAKSRQRKAAR